MALQLPSLSLHQQIQQCVGNFHFQRLFIEILNWNKPKERTPIHTLVNEHGLHLGYEEIIDALEHFTCYTFEIEVDFK